MSDSTTPPSHHCLPKVESTHNEGLILHPFCCFARQHYHLCAAMIVSVDLAGDTPWQDAHLKVCLPAYY